MKISIVAVGELKNSPEFEIFNSYLKRITWQVQIKEIKHQKKGHAEENNLLRKAIEPDSTVIALDRSGVHVTSEEIASLISSIAESSMPKICFIIGGSDGLNADTLKIAKHKIAFGKVTLPHMLARLILVEQIYRAQTIISGHPYHK